MITVATHLAQRLAANGHRHVFLVTGGGAMFLNDALCHHPDLTPVFFHHEQAAAMAAEAYARIAERPPILNVTTGPGGINALNGVFGAWTDSVPMIVISGQVKRATCLAATPVPGLRQLGDQECAIVPMVRGMTKYACVVEQPEDIDWHLDQATHLATSGRPGPVWLDIPIDVQSASVDPKGLRRFMPEPAVGNKPSASDLQAIVGRLRAAQRPVILAGGGVRAAKATAEFESLVRRLGIPVTTAWTHDLVASDDPLFCGRPGTIGTRAGNFTVQSADLLLILGSRLNIRQISYNWQGFAPRAFKIQVDIDPAETGKPTLKPDLAIIADLKQFVPRLAAQLADWQPTDRQQRWLAWCRERVLRYPNVLPRHRENNNEKINPYHFVETLFAELNGQDIVACGNASACIVPFQAGVIKRGMRMFSNSGSASMGYDLPAAIGAYFGALNARGTQQRVICLAGDGSIMMNIQELQTVAQHRLPIKIFVLDNQGYLSIRTSQSNFFGRLAGAGPESGIELPDFVAVAKAFGIPATRLDSADFAERLAAVLDAPGPHLCQVMLDETQQFEPRMASRRLDDGSIVTPPLEDMFPFLDRKELAANLIDDRLL
ncbi:MAG: Acetolactate synthase large subunit [Candidatus Accumulibacter appositus]|uniref:Acetolactate synthase large subunit n=1 Tax=Candidatus Accumulibacter appositus TaxID=1454003 RepID=A0A011PNS7_9PROT|nr:thiamine pyrophosphate-binding protein [Accumulibacter sp.]EXI78682.1 MAG: Acetolactate synthase large subunit [Candidatus Accumulibacter appositus]HRF03341.1 thiamine pyrophosphate-binding protein [Accumulibacter sp.]